MSTVEFGTLFQFIRNGMSVKQDKSGDGVPITRIETIWNSGIDADRVGYAGLDINACKGWLLQNGDILFSHINSVEHIGKCAVYLGNPSQLAHGMNLLCLRCDQTKIIPEFAKHLIRSKEFRSKLANYINKAVNQASVSIGNLKGISVTIPPLLEQRRIAAILDKTDGLRAKRRDALTHLDSLAQSIFVEMFGDPVTNPKKWVESEMATLFETSPIFGTMIPPTSDGGDWLSLRVGNIQDWQLDLSDQKYVNLPPNTIARHSVKDGDLLLARAIASQEHLGKAVVVNPAGRKWAFDSHLMRLRFNPERASPEYIRHLWMTPGGRSLFLKATRRTAVQFNINTKEMNSLRLPIPPIDLQRNFVCRVEVLNCIRQKHLAALNEIDMLFSTLQHRAFSREIDGSNGREFVCHENGELTTN